MIRKAVFIEAMPEAPFPSWKQGQATRARILEVIENHPNWGIHRIAKELNLSLQQVKRQRKWLKIEGKI